MKKTILIIIFLLISFLVFCQDNSVRMLLLFEENTETSFSESELLIIYETLIVKLDNEIDNLNIIESNKNTLPQTDDERTALAESLNVHSWLTIGITGDMDDLDITLKLFDISGEDYIIDEKLKNKSIGSFREFSRQFWNEVIDIVDEKYIKTNPTAKKITMDNAQKCLIIIKAKTGTKITGLDEEPLIIGEEEEIQYETFIPSTVSIYAYLKGYYPEKIEIFADEETETVAFEQRPIRRVFIDVYMNNFSFFGSDLSVFIVPDYFYFKTGLTTHLFGFHFGVGDDDDSFFVSYPLTYFYSGIGTYLNPNHHAVRANLSAVFFTRIIHSNKYGFSVDRLFPFGVQPIIGVEFFPGKRFCAFLEYAPYIYFSNDKELMNAAYPDNYDFRSYLITDKMLIEFWNFRIGMRIRL